MKDQLSKKFDELGSDTKKKLVIAMVAVLVLPVLYLFLNSGPEVKERAVEEPIRDALFGTRTNDLGINGLIAQVGKERSEREKAMRLMDERLARIETSLDIRDDNAEKQAHRLQALLRKTIAELDARKVEMDKEMEQQAQILERQRVEIEKRIAAIESREPTVIVSQGPSTDEPAGRKTAVKSSSADKPEAAEVKTSKEALVEEDWEIFSGSTTSGFADPIASTSGTGGNQGGAGKQTAPATIMTFGVTGSEVIVEQPTQEEESSVFLPAGSIITGTLLSGMDAPTGKNAMSQPYPATLRIKHEAILPNEYSLDVRECFLLSGGFGDLSSERAYLRAEILSCIRNDGGVIEVPLDAYAVGSDGKVGIRGRLVSKQGQMLAAALQAGFAEGIAKAFAPQRQFSFNSEDDSDSVNYQFPNPRDVASVGFAGGASRALERLADFYIDMAEQIFPIIEIDGGRSVTFITKKGVELKLRKS